MTIRKSAKNAMEHVKKAAEDTSTTSRAVLETTSWATVALVSVAALSLLSLAMGLYALRQIGGTDGG